MTNRQPAALIFQIIIITKCTYTPWILFEVLKKTVEEFYGVCWRAQQWSLVSKVFPINGTNGMGKIPPLQSVISQSVPTFCSGGVWHLLLEVLFHYCSTDTPLHDQADGVVWHPPGVLHRPVLSPRSKVIES